MNTPSSHHGTFMAESHVQGRLQTKLPSCNLTLTIACKCVNFRTKCAGLSPEFTILRSMHDVSIFRTELNIPHMIDSEQKFQVDKKFPQLSFHFDLRFLPDSTRPGRRPISTGWTELHLTLITACKRTSEQCARAFL